MKSDIQGLRVIPVTIVVIYQVWQHLLIGGFRCKYD